MEVKISIIFLGDWSNEIKELKKISKFKLFKLYRKLKKNPIINDIRLLKEKN